jgi:CRP-like cAMP-binding protein
VDDSASQRSVTLGLLHGVYCLRPLELPLLEGLIGRLLRVFVPNEGNEIIRQGDRGDRFYIVETGTAEVVVDGFVVGVLGPGDSFGERALLRDVPRAATIRSKSPMHLLTLSREDFLVAVTGQEGAEAPSDGARSPDGKLEWTLS